MSNGKLKKLVKKGVSKLKDRAVDTVKDAIKDESRKTRRGKKSVRVGQPRQAEPDVTVSKTIKLKDRKKNRQKKKIAKWEQEKRNNAKAAAGSARAAFFALDKKYKNE